MLQTLEFIRDHEHHGEYVQGSGYDEQQAQEEYWHYEGAPEEEGPQEEAAAPPASPTLPSNGPSEDEAAGCGSTAAAAAAIAPPPALAEEVAQETFCGDGDLPEPSWVRDRGVSAPAARHRPQSFSSDEEEEEEEAAVAELSLPPRPSSAGKRRISLVRQSKAGRTSSRLPRASLSMDTLHEWQGAGATTELGDRCLARVPGAGARRKCEWKEAVDTRRRSLAAGAALRHTSCIQEDSWVRGPRRLSAFSSLHEEGGKEEEEQEQQQEEEEEEEAAAQLATRRRGCTPPTPCSSSLPTTEPSSCPSTSCPSTSCPSTSCPTTSGAALLPREGHGWGAGGRGEDGGAVVPGGGAPGGTGRCAEGGMPEEVLPETVRGEEGKASGGGGGEEGKAGREDTEGEGGEAQARLAQPYEVVMVGVMVDVPTAVVRGFRRHVLTGRSVPLRPQLRSHRLFARNFEALIPLVDQALLVESRDDRDDPLRLVAQKEGAAERLEVHDGDAWGRLRRQASSLNENAVRPAELFNGGE